MAARRKTRPRSRGARGGTRATRAQNFVIESVQQIWLAGMGAIARAQKGGPAAFQDAVADGLQLLNRSRSSTEKVIREAFENAQATMQSRVDVVREQAEETWDNLEALFQSRVQKALNQIGVPSADEVRLLTRRVAELNEAVKQLAGSKGRKARRPVPAKRGRARARA